MIEIRTNPFARLIDYATEAQNRRQPVTAWRMSRHTAYNIKTEFVIIEADEYIERLMHGDYSYPLSSATFDTINEIAGILIVFDEAIPENLVIPEF